MTPAPPTTARPLGARFDALPAPSPAERLVWGEGTAADYRALAPFHYLAQAPATATRVLTLRDPSPGLAERWRAMLEPAPTEPAPAEPAPDEPASVERLPGEPPGGVVWPGAAGAAGAGRVVGVLVESLPALSCRLRDVALCGRYAGWSDRGAAARLLNAEVRCISRVVVHPQWRGLGLAGAMVRRALATTTTRYTEALAAMGRVHPFFRLAGMREYRRPPLPRDQRLIDALRWAGLEPWALADRARARAAFNGEGVEARTLRRELRRWARGGGGGRPGARRAEGAGTIEARLDRARARLLCEPVYYLYARSEP